MTVGSSCVCEKTKVETGMSWAVISALLAVALLGHVMAAIWYAAMRGDWRICNRKIYDLPIEDKQLRREFMSSLHTPLHAVFLLVFLWLGCFQNRSVISFFGTLALAFVWAEIWHYASHRAFHLKVFHWIHVEHHRSHINSPLTAISFSFTEKAVFDIGMIGLLAVIDLFVSLNFFGVAGWYIGYLIINSVSHANFELRPGSFNATMGRVLTSTTYHSLHHSRYTGNYGLGTRIIDRMFGTEWTDYEPLYERVTVEKRPLSKLREKVEPVAAHALLLETTRKSR